MLNLDTHILIYALADRLPTPQRRLLAGQPWSISAIVLWELAKLHDLGRITLDIGSAEFGRALAAIHVWPLDLAVCRALRRLDFKSDLADEIIAATSLAHNVPLLTDDRVIRKSKLVPMA
jgi:PIN domain nuclease of toxin-antitoxin system